MRPAAPLRELARPASRADRRFRTGFPFISEPETISD
jgi:hypothetical protein